MQYNNTNIGTQLNVIL